MGPTTWSAAAVAGAVRCFRRFIYASARVLFAFFYFLTYGEWSTLFAPDGGFGSGRSLGATIPLGGMGGWVGGWVGQRPKKGLYRSQMPGPLDEFHVFPEANDPTARCVSTDGLYPLHYSPYCHGRASPRTGKGTGRLGQSCCHATTRVAVDSGGCEAGGGRGGGGAAEAAPLWDILEYQGVRNRRNLEWQNLAQRKCAKLCRGILRTEAICLGVIFSALGIHDPNVTGTQASGSLWEITASIHKFLRRNVGIFIILCSGI